MMKKQSIQIIDRMTGDLFEEKVYGDLALKWAYQTGLGKSSLKVLTLPLFSKLYGQFQSSRLSKGKIADFIKKYKVNMDEFLPGEGGGHDALYKSFNEFFIRRFKEGARSFDDKEDSLGAFAEGRYLAHEAVDSLFLVKGQEFSVGNLLGEGKWNAYFQKGPLMIARLCPVDYHRFHFPTQGKILDYYTVGGHLHSVNPMALKEKSDILETNERQVSILETKRFGKLAYIEVGAMFVGRIVQTKRSRQEFLKGEEKGYFLFGGSTVCLLGEPGLWSPSRDILENTKKGYESFVRLGDSIGAIK